MESILLKDEVGLYNEMRLGKHEYNLYDVVWMTVCYYEYVYPEMPFRNGNLWTLWPNERLRM